jgi:hypothetical protein
VRGRVWRPLFENEGLTAEPACPHTLRGGLLRRRHFVKHSELRARIVQQVARRFNVPTAVTEVKRPLVSSAGRNRHRRRNVAGVDLRPTSYLCATSSISDLEREHLVAPAIAGIPDTNGRCTRVQKRDPSRWRGAVIVEVNDEPQRTGVNVCQCEVTS